MSETLPKWRIVVDETSTTSVAFTLDDAPHTLSRMKVATKWDGCTHLWLYEKDDHTGEEIESYYHICNLDEFIAQLQAVREKARTYFFGDFSLAPITEAERLEQIAKLEQSDVVEGTMQSAPQVTVKLMLDGKEIALKREG